MPANESRRLPCGCQADGGYVCDLHWRPEPTERRDAGNVMSLAALSLLMAMLFVFAAVLTYPAAPIGG